MADILQRSVLLLMEYSPMTGSTSISQKLYIGIGLLLTLPFVVAALVMIWNNVKTYTIYQTGQCMIISKELRKHRKTYSPSFEFTVSTLDGERLATASGYDVNRSSSSAQYEHTAVLDRFLVEHTYPCWYHPARPSKAVLVRGFDWESLLILGLSIAIGATIIVAGQYHFRNSQGR
jgi:hypothetical protein